MENRNNTAPAHTPGPWILVDEGSIYPGIDAEGQNIILNSDFGQYCGVRGGSREQVLANACLIAAAPRLLDQCREMKRFLRAELRIFPGDQGLLDLIADLDAVIKDTTA